MRVLVFGATGMLGRDLVATVPPNVDLVFSRRGRVDLTSGEQLHAALDESRPDCVINAAGYTAVDRAEDEAELAEVVNGAAVARLATACAGRDIGLVHF